jgi:mRNA-degrading endonuclease HigB of HigAB toxin-antitoxin module
LIAANTLAEYAAQQPGAAALNHWRQMIKAADWKDMNDVKAAASTAEVLNGERVRVEVAGGRFRLIGVDQLQPRNRLREVRRRAPGI